MSTTASAAPPRDDRAWRSGSWSLSRREAAFADLAFDGAVVLSDVRVGVSDDDGNVTPLLVERAHETGDTVTLHVRSGEPEVDVRGVVRVEARPSRLDIACDLESARPFTTRRAGIVVLHPSHVGGAPLRVLRSDGLVEETSFPIADEPQPPVSDVAALAWLDDAREVSTSFAGAAFELEDRRAGAESAFRTSARRSSTDLAGGRRVRQTVSLRVRRTALLG